MEMSEEKKWWDTQKESRRRRKTYLNTKNEETERRIMGQIKDRMRNKEVKQSKWKKKDKKAFFDEKDEAVFSVLLD